MSGFVASFLNLETLLSIWPILLDGLGVTAGLVVVTVPLGVLVGLAVAVLYSLHLRALNPLIMLYVDFLRSFPPLVLLIMIFYGLPFLGINLGGFLATAVALVLNSSSYYGEIFRAGIESIPRGQAEAARSTGLSAAAALAYVVLPQALRNVAAPLAGNTLELVKATSIASAVALPELLRAARAAQGLVYNPTPLVAAAVIYFVLLWPFVRLVARLERQIMSSH
ncbi:MAG: amino acid ABC transporter permease [Alphaproteobacteria bacterium]